MESPRVNEEISLDNVPSIMSPATDPQMGNGNGSHILMFAVVSLKHFVNGLFCLAISLKGLRSGHEARLLQSQS